MRAASPSAPPEHHTTKLYFLSTPGKAAPTLRFVCRHRAGLGTDLVAAPALPPWQLWQYFCKRQGEVEVACKTHQKALVQTQQRLPLV